MPSFNKVIIAGHLTRDPEVRYTPNGAAVATFALAVNRKFKQGDETKEEVSFFDCVALGKTAETAGKHLHKGDALLIDGRLQQRRWDDKETGAKRSKVEVVLNTMTFLGKKGGSGGQSQPQAGPADDTMAADGDIPF